MRNGVDEEVIGEVEHARSDFTLNVIHLEDLVREGLASLWLI